MVTFDKPDPLRLREKVWSNLKSSQARPDRSYHCPRYINGMNCGKKQSHKTNIIVPVLRLKMTKFLYSYHTLLQAIF